MSRFVQIWNEWSDKHHALLLAMQSLVEVNRRSADFVSRSLNCRIRKVTPMSLLGMTNLADELLAARMEFRSNLNGPEFIVKDGIEYRPYWMCQLCQRADCPEAIVVFEKIRKKLKAES